MWTNITDEDIAKASETVEVPGEMGGGLLGLGEEGTTAGDVNVPAQNTGVQRL